MATNRKTIDGLIEKLISESVSIALIGQGNPALGSSGSDYFKNKSDVIQLKSRSDFSWDSPGYWYVFYSGHNGHDQHTSAMLIHSDHPLQTFNDPYGNFRKHPAAVEIDQALTRVEPEWSMDGRGGAGSLKSIQPRIASRILKYMDGTDPYDVNDVDDMDDMVQSGDILNYGDHILPEPKDLEGSDLGGRPRHPWT